MQLIPELQEIDNFFASIPEIFPYIIVGMVIVGCLLFVIFNPDRT